MFESSMVLSVGQALDRAIEENLLVRISVGGEWISGHVVRSDGHGVALAEDNGDLCILRTEAITGVRLSAAAQTRRVHSERTEARVPAQL